MQVGSKSGKLSSSPRERKLAAELGGAMARIVLCTILLIALPLGARSAADVRLVDEAGGISSVGLVQVATDAGFGTVCGANAAAADATRLLTAFEPQQASFA